MSFATMQSLAVQKHSRGVN